MATSNEVRVPVIPELPENIGTALGAAIVRPGDILIVGLADTDNVNAVAKGMQTALEPLGIRVLVLDNVRQMMVARPNADEEDGES